MNSTDAFNPLTPMSDQDRTSPYNIKQTSNENKEKYQSRDCKLIQYQFSKPTSQGLYNRQ